MSGLIIAEFTLGRGYSNKIYTQDKTRSKIDQVLPKHRFGQQMRFKCVRVYPIRVVWSAIISSRY